MPACAGKTPSKKYFMRKNISATNSSRIIIYSAKLIVTPTMYH